MNSINHPNCHRYIGKPADWNESEHGVCMTLPIEVGQSQGLQFLYSYWQPTAEELQILVSGGYVKLGIAGKSHPVIQIGIEP